MDDDAIKWNPYNKVVQNHRDGTIDHEQTDLYRRRLGLITPWVSLIGELECKLPPVWDVIKNSSLKAGCYRNIKTGRLYRATHSVFNSTNAQNGQVMVCYYDLENPEAQYARELAEFKFKFTYEDLP